MTDQLHRFIDNVSDAYALKALIKRSGLVAYDCETHGFKKGKKGDWGDPHQGEIRLMQFGIPEGGRIQPYVVDTMYVPPVLFRDAFASKDTTFIGHNLCFDLKFLLAHGIKVARCYDTMLAAQVAESGWQHFVGKHGLADVAARTIQIEINKEEQASDWSGPLTEQQLRYAGIDVLHLHAIAGILDKHLQEKGMGRVIELENRALPAFAWMEFQGVELDEAHVLALKFKLATMLEQQLATIAGLMGQRTVTREKKERIPKEERDLMAAQMGVTRKEVPQWRTITYQSIEDWNPGSHQQLEEWFKLNNLPLPVNDEGSISFDKVALQQSVKHPIAQALMAWRQTDKLFGTYVNTLLDRRNPVTNRVHTHFKQIVPSGSRISSSDPNLQNIPSRTELGREIRKAFCAGMGELMLISDFSQIEIIGMAMRSGDPVMCGLLRAGADLHAETCREVFEMTYLPKSDPRRKEWEQGTNYDGITPFAMFDPMRDVSKTLNFSGFYGGGAKTLTEQAEFKVSVDVMERALEKKRSMHPVLVQYFQGVTKHAIERGYSVSILGRRRYYYKPRNRREAAKVSLEANNHEIQSTAKEFMLGGMIVAYERGVDLRITCHDELVGVAAAEKAEEQRLVLHESMVEGANRVVAMATVPIERSLTIKADTKIGRSWADKK